ncbi:hypothetical protein GTY75_08845 [Streptomyces sp. SID8381]|nr:MULTISPECIES: hypothetical protein [unclassified Streptomyces]MYX26776.1 hypothetical protein [Streptomyces sp. SID8381]
MTKLLLLAVVGLVLLRTARRPSPPAPMALLQQEENRRFAELCRRRA